MTGSGCFYWPGYCCQITDLLYKSKPFLSVVEFYTNDDEDDVYKIPRAQDDYVWDIHSKKRIAKQLFTNRW